MTSRCRNPDLEPELHLQVGHWPPLCHPEEAIKFRFTCSTWNSIYTARSKNGREQGCKKITIFDLKDQDLLIDLDLLHDLDHLIDLLKLILIFDL